jgi:internalin A
VYASQVGIGGKHIMKSSLIVLALFYIISLSAQIIPDDNFRICINQELDQPDDYEPTIEDLNSLDGDLSMMEKGIESIEGAQYLTGISNLDLLGNQISDLTPLGELDSLQILYLEQNLISDITPLSGLSGLIGLFIMDNQISDVSPLIGLTNLRHLYLDNNQINDISPLSAFTDLDNLSLSDNMITELPYLDDFHCYGVLFLRNNMISDLTPISQIGHIDYLDISGNRITDLSALMNNDNHSISNHLILSRTFMDSVHSNPLSLEAVEVQIPYLENMDYQEIVFSDEPNLNVACYPNPDNNSMGIAFNRSLYWTGHNDIATYEVYLGTSQDNLQYVGVGEMVTESLNSCGYELQPETEYWWKIKSIIDSQEFWSGIWHFTTSSSSAIIPDPGLRAAINNTLGQPENYEASIAELNDLTGYINAQDSNVMSLEGIQYLTQISGLNLSDNSITDISLLAFLTNLTNLNLSNNFIDDLNALSELTELTQLQLTGNQIIDIEPLICLSSLTDLSLGDNLIMDISDLAGLPNLEELRIENNAIHEIQTLANLENLNVLTIYGNNIIDIYPLIENQGLGEGDHLFLHIPYCYNLYSLETDEVHIPILQERGFSNLQYLDYIDPYHAPCYPEPERYAENIGYATNMSWYSVNSSLTYKVYMGDSPDNMIYVGNGEYAGDDRWSFSPELSPNTEYWWCVKTYHEDPFFNNDYWSGIWHFTTGNDESGSGEDIVESIDSVKLTNYPNPFNPNTTISFSLNTESTENTEIEIFNIKGQKIRSYNVSFDSAKDDTYTIVWSGTDNNNHPVSSGIYMINLKSGDRNLAQKKCMLLK